MTTETLPRPIPLFSGPSEYSKKLFGQSFSQEAPQASSALPESFPALHAAQQLVHQAPERFKVVNFGRQAGKTTLAKRLVAEAALKGESAAYVVPIYRTLKQVFLDLKEALRDFVVSAQDNERINLRGGGFIEFWSMHNGGDRARGRIYHRVVFDECAMVPGVLGIWESVWRLTVSRHQGDAYFFSTPRRGGGFQKLYERGETGEPDWASFTIDTSANPFITTEEFEAIRRGMSKERFAQEVMADFEAADSELVFPQFSARRHVGTPVEAWADCKVRLACVDPGGGDPTAIYFLTLDSKEVINVHAPEFYKRGGVSTGEISDWVWRPAKKPQVVVVGETGGNVIVPSLIQVGIPAEKAELKPDDNREYIRWALDNDRLRVDPRCENMIAEFGLWRWRIKTDPFEGDTYVTSMTGDRHADAMSALGYGIARILRWQVEAERKTTRANPRDWYGNPHRRAG